MRSLGQTVWFPHGGVPQGSHLVSHPMTIECANNAQQKASTDAHP